MSHFAVHHSAVNVVNGGISKSFNFQFSIFSLFRIFVASFFPSTLFNGLRQREGGRENIVIMRSSNNLKTYGNKNTH